MVAPVAPVGGKGVQGKQRRHDAHRPVLAEFPRDLEQANLAFGIEPIARFDLDRRAATGHQRMQPAAALSQQFLVGRGARLRHGRCDPAAGFRDFLIGRAGAAHRVLVGARAAEDEVRVAVDQAGRDPGAAQRVDLLRAITGELGPLADADDPAVGDPHRAILDNPEAGAFERGDVAVDEQPVPHVPFLGLPLGEASCYGKAMAGWPNLSDLIVSADSNAPVGLLGAPLAAGSVTPGRCDLAPDLLRATLRRIGRYNVENERELATAIADHGNVDLDRLSIEQAFEPIRDAVRESVSRRSLTLLIGGNNAVTRPGLRGMAEALDLPLAEVGLITLDAHFDMREHRRRTQQRQSRSRPD